MSTIAQLIALGQTVTAQCRRCGRRRTLDLAALALQWGDTDLADLPLRCEGIVAEPDGPGVAPCGSRAMSWTVAPTQTGPRGE
jgi:hypothetical protein